MIYDSVYWFLFLRSSIAEQDIIIKTKPKFDNTKQDIRMQRDITKRQVIDLLILYCALLCIYNQSFIKLNQKYNFHQCCDGERVQTNITFLYCQQLQFVIVFDLLCSKFFKQQLRIRINKQMATNWKIYLMFSFGFMIAGIGLTLLQIRTCKLAIGFPIICDIDGSDYCCTCCERDCECEVYKSGYAFVSTAWFLFFSFLLGSIKSYRLSKTQSLKRRKPPIAARYSELAIQ